MRSLLDADGIVERLPPHYVDRSGVTDLLRAAALIDGVRLPLHLATGIDSLHLPPFRSSIGAPGRR